MEFTLFKVKKAICYFYDKDCKKSHGFCTLVEYPDRTVINLNLKDLSPGPHGFHIHEYADPRNKLMNLGPHYNPEKKNHGNLNEEDSHMGDLGNIAVANDGTCKEVIVARKLPLNNPDGVGVIGRAIVIHAGEDDLGEFPDEESKTSGHSGARIAYGVIGYCM